MVTVVGISVRKFVNAAVCVIGAFVAGVVVGESVVSAGDGIADVVVRWAAKAVVSQPPAVDQWRQLYLKYACAVYLQTNYTQCKKDV